MTLLVTGGAGFMGSHFIQRKLADRSAGRADKIVCLDNFNDYYDPALKRANVALFAADPRVEVVEQSFLDVAAMSRLFDRHRIRHVVHLGGYAGVRASVARALEYAEHNVLGTLSLLEAARLVGVERFVFVSSSTVYGREAVAPFVEDAPLGTPLSPYGATKLSAELLARTYYQLHHVPVVCLRPFSVYGPRIRPDLAMHLFARAILDQTPIPLFGDGTIRRDFTHVSDICTGILAAIEAPDLLGEAINLGHHEPAPIAQLLSMLEDALHRKAIIDHQPASPADMPLTCADLTKAHRLLGYQPKVSLADGIREFVDWFCQSRDR